MDGILTEDGRRQNRRIMMTTNTPTSAVNVKGVNKVSAELTAPHTKDQRENRVDYLLCLVSLVYAQVSVRKVKLNYRECCKIESCLHQSRS